MPISAAFSKYAENDPVYLDSSLTDEMKNLGFVFFRFHQVNNNPEIPDVDCEELIERLGGEEEIDADYDGLDKFTVIHKATQSTFTTNSAKEALCRVWVIVQNKQKTHTS